MTSFFPCSFYLRHLLNTQLCSTVGVKIYEPSNRFCCFFRVHRTFKKTFFEAKTNEIDAYVCLLYLLALQTSITAAAANLSVVSRPCMYMYAQEDQERPPPEPTDGHFASARSGGLFNGLYLPFFLEPLFVKAITSSSVSPIILCALLSIHPSSLLQDR